MIPSSLSPSRLFGRNRRQGYSHLSISANGNGNGNSNSGSNSTFRGGRRGEGGGREEDENRLIDQLDEEWDD